MNSSTVDASTEYFLPRTDAVTDITVLLYTTITATSTNSDNSINLDIIFLLVFDE